ncbi:MAG: hypothetical protein HY323_01940 [Betaproteobacteria bacterium]|nr:hypothetical protein [Betaproteobacteria bacterium]
MAGAILLMPCVADAAGLGRLTVLSSLGQPLVAEIELASVQKEELATLTARLASPDAYRQANMQYGPALAGLRFSVEKRPTGQPYIKITSARAVNEPYLDLLVELSWASGRLIREYAALIDPPEFAPTPTVPPVAVPGVKPALPVAPPARAVAPAEEKPAAVERGADSYGPVRRGETLHRIAESVKPEGVTLEQTLVGLFRSNKDAFVGNMNRLKTGKILRVPGREELVAVAPGEARREVRVQVADWNEYRRRLAASAAATPAQESRVAAAGRITTEDKAAGKAPPKDVVRLSKGEPPRAAAAPGKAPPRTMAERVRALEEEAVSREKALSEANERMAQLEKTIKEMQRLLELRGQVPGVAPKPAPAAKPEAAKPEPKPAPAAKAEPAKPEPVKPEAVAVAKPEAAKPEAKIAPEKPAPAKPEAPKAEQPKPKPKPKVVAPPPSLLDEVLGEPLYLVGGAAVILLGGLGFWMVRRRRPAAEEEKAPVRAAPKLAKAPAEPAAHVEPVVAAAAAAAPAVAAAAPIEEVDSLAEAEVYIAYGRDAQAEEILKDALAKNPAREDVKLKLLEIYAARKDKNAFDKLARDFHAGTGGAGETWIKVAAMGYALDAANPLYEAGKSAPGAAPAAPAPGADLDFDLGLGAPAGTASTDIAVEPEVAAAETAVAPAPEPVQPAEEKPVEPLLPDFNIELPQPGAETKADIALEPAAAPAGGGIDFSIELPKIEEAAPAGEVAGVGVEPPKQEGGGIDFDLGEAAKPEAAPSGAEAALEPAAGGEAAAPLDFKLDLGGIDLSLEDKPKAEEAQAGAKDGHWYDVQTKFDLAKAYQEMGDKDGAKEILQEVIKEGDEQQQAEAKKLLETLG